ncbi:MAG: filamentous hemagglutinin N-terminal domain-containing protein, partial [bacterium]
MRRLTKRQKAVSLVVAMQIIFCQASPLLAMPKGEHVTGGDVSFSRQGDTMTILQTSHKAIVNFDSFSIGAPESVQFIQPDSSAAILNRVTGDQGSVIAGIMLANGNVYLINPNGILFSSTAKISVASLFASALDITDADFLSGRLLFSGGSGSVINQGEITATERAGLFGSTVENSGVIKAGNVLMDAATTSIEIDNAAGGAIRLIVDGQVVDPRSTTESPAQTTPAPQPDSITQPAGTAAPESDTETVPVAASPSETIQIPSDSSAAVVQDAATAGMVINQGTVSASGDSGGSVTMSGIRVGQFGIVSANGSSGNGGIVNITASDTVALGETSVTTANAGPNGNGGTVTVFSPDTALFRRGSKIEARGGSETGDGGFIEVSGRQHVEIYGTTDASAQNGKAGTFLIDPSDVTLANSPPGDGDWIPGGGPPYTQFNPNTDTATADIGILLVSLQNNNVIITTANGGGSQLGNITVADPINLDGTGGHQLYLQANNNISVNANIADLTPATIDATIVILQANNDVTINAIVDTGGGNLSINADGNVTINADVITDGGSFISGGHDFTSTAGSTITTGGGDVNMLGHSGAVSINDTIDTTGGAGQIRIYGTSITLNQNINPVVLNSGGAILLRTADITINGNVVGPSVTIADTTGIGIGLGATPVPGGLNVSGTELQHITTAALELDTAGSITVDNIVASESLNVNVLTLDAGAAISFANNGSTFRALVGQADNGIMVDAHITTATGNLSLDGDANNAANGSDNITFADGVQLTSAGSLTLDATTGDMTSAGALALVANNGVSINDSLSGPPAAGIVLISADTDANGSGTATIAPGATVNEFSGMIMISANDLNLQGNLSASSIIIAESHGGGIGLGATPGGLTVSGSALQRIASTDLTLATPGSIAVNNIAASDSLNSGAVTLSAGVSVTFASNPSTFDSLIVRANDGVTVDTD